MKRVDQHKRELSKSVSTMSDKECSTVLTAMVGMLEIANKETEEKWSLEKTKNGRKN